MILQLIKELAEYEKILNEVVATEEMLKEKLFEKQQAEVTFLMEDEVEVGFSLFFHNISTFLSKAGLYLEGLYVKPERRSLGYGNELLKQLA